MLDRVHQQVGWVATWEEVHDAHRLATWEYEVVMGNLVHLNLCRPSPNPKVFEEANAGRSTEWLSYQRVELTRLGRAFVYACQSSA